MEPQVGQRGLAKKCLLPLVARSVAVFTHLLGSWNFQPPKTAMCFDHPKATNIAQTLYVLVPTLTHQSHFLTKTSKTLGTKNPQMVTSLRSSAIPSTSIAPGGGL